MPSVIVAGLSVVLSSILAQVICLSKNTLMLNDQWILTKMEMEMIVMGNNQFYGYRSALAGNQLNLGEWYGNQEVVTKKEFAPDQITINARLAKYSFIMIGFGPRLGPRKGVIISRIPDFPSAFVELRRDGGFVSKEVAPIHWDSGKRFTLKVQSGKIPGETIVLLDDLIVARKPNFPITPGPISLRGGAARSVIDSVEVQSLGKRVFVDEFHNTKFFWRLFILFFCLSIGGSLIFFKFSKIPNEKDRQFQLALFLVLLCLISSIWYGFDFKYWGTVGNYNLVNDARKMGRTPVQYYFLTATAVLTEIPFRIVGGRSVSRDVVWRNAINPKVTYIGGGPFYCGKGFNRTKICERVSRVQLNEIINRPKTGTRIVFAGTSQTFGSGAERLDQTFVALIHKELSRRFKDKLETINLAISGANSEILLGEVKSFAPNLRPDYLVLNFSNNDLNHLLRDRLQNFIDYGNSIGAKTILIQEANDMLLGDPANFLRRYRGLMMPVATVKHRILVDLSRERGIPLLRLHDHLAAPEQLHSGFLWWDVVHMTTYGQSLAAAFLAPRIEDILTNPKSSSKYR